MGAEQREAMWEQLTRRETALARWGLACATACALSLASGKAAADPPSKEAMPATPKPTNPVRLPSHTRDDTGRVADPRILHGDSKIENADTTTPAGERVVRPIQPLPGANSPGNTTEPPPFHYAPTTPAPAVDAGPAPDALSEWVTGTGSQGGNRKDRGTTKTTSGKTGPAVEAVPPIPEEPAAPTVLDLVRAEIRSRLPYFQVCADSARRRAGIEMRRLQATWLINADGTIKEFRLDEVPDKPLAACLIRAGSRPFSVQPGMDLAIPTPIVFVR